MLVYARISGLKKYQFLSRFLCCQQAPRALTPVNARVGPLARLLLFFTVTIMLLQIFTRHGELRLDVAFEFGLMGGSGRSAIVLSGSLAMIGSVLPRWQCNIERISPERTEGYCHSGSAISRGYRRTSRRVLPQWRCRRTDRRVLPQWQCDIERRLPERPGQLIPKKAQKLRAGRTPRASSRDWREHTYTRNIKNFKNKK